MALKRFLVSESIFFLFLMIFLFGYFYYFKGLEITLMVKYLILFFIIWVGFIVFSVAYSKSSKKSRFKRGFKKYIEKYPKVALINLVLLGVVSLLFLSLSLSRLILISLSLFASGLVITCLGILILYSPQEPKFYDLAVILSAGVLFLFIEKSKHKNLLKKIFVYMEGLILTFVGIVLLITALFIPL